MTVHNDGKGCFNIANQDLPVFDFDSELSFQSFMDMNAGRNITIIILISEMCFKCYWHIFPSRRVNQSEPFSNTFDDSLRS